MQRVFTYSFKEDFIKSLADFIEIHYIRQNKDLSRVAIVFGGKRPSLFLKRELSKRLKKSFFPPHFFTIDEFVEYIISRDLPLLKVTDLDACYIIYNLAEEISKEILGERQKFCQFLPWSREILTFIEQLDLEDVKADSLQNIQLKASIGYDIPQSINTLLRNITSLRQGFHRILKERNLYYRGLIYLEAAQLIEELDLDEFTDILFCGLFFLHKTEEKIIKQLYLKQKAKLFFQGSQDDWAVLKDLSKVLSCQIRPSFSGQIDYNLKIFSGFDTHSQVALIRTILKDIKDLENTVVVLPEPENLIPLISEISSVVREFNVSMGYPLRHSSLYCLFDLIFKAQISRKKGQYYTKDYLKVLGHPLIKNLKIFEEPSITRVLVHKIEEFLLGIQESYLGGSLFINLEDIQNLRDIYESSVDTLKSMNIKVDFAQLQEIVRQLHRISFYIWEEVNNLYDFSDSLSKFINYLLHHSFISSYPLNLKIIEKLLSIKDELQSTTFNREEFFQEDIFKIFKDKLENKMIAFWGSPLVGLQILGLFETRSLNFKNVIIMDVNESVLPKLRIYDPLIPREVALALGINYLEKEEQIQHYQFMRLISGAENVYLVYEESQDKQKSRFIEELIWQRQKQIGSLEALSISKATFKVKVLPKRVEIEKSHYLIKFLKDYVYSASSIDAYLKCPLAFYYQFILDLKEREELDEEPGGADIGNFIHSLLEKTFINFLGRRPVIDNRFKEYFFNTLEEEFNERFQRRMKSDAFMLKEIVKIRLERFLEQEAKRDIKEIVWLEHQLQDSIVIDGQRFNFKARIDRIDRLTDDSLFIIDYKTGSQELLPKSIDKISEMELSRVNIKNTIRSFQIPLYFYFVRKRFKDLPLNAGLYYLRTCELKPFLKSLNQISLDDILDLFMKALRFVIYEILNPEVKFKADDTDPYICSHCEFFYLCR